MPLVELWNLDSFFGFICLGKTGVTYSNQVGGTACHHPEVEGFYVPLPPPAEDFEDPTRDFWGEHNPELIEMFLQVSGYDRFFEPDPDKLVREAWIPVVVKSSFEEHSPGSELLGGLTGRAGFITYQNSD